MKRLLALTGILCLALLTRPHPVQADTGVVNTILFYDPAQTASQQVFAEVLPPILEQQGNHLLLYTVDVSREEGKNLFQSAAAAFQFAGTDEKLPLLIIGDTVLSGKAAIESDFSALVTRLPTAGWPAIPGLDRALQASGILQGPQDPWQKFLNDQPGNSLALLVLAGLAISMVYSILAIFRIVRDAFSALPWWILPILLLAGVFISSYLSYTEITQSKVSCGGISNCQAVQDSPYSHLLGIIPVGVFGLLGNLLIGSAWLVSRFASGRIRSLSIIAMFGFAFFGASYSMYLTFLEPFVIGATCLWCLGSAVVMSLILPSTIGPIREMIRLSVQHDKDAATAHE